MNWYRHEQDKNDLWGGMDGPSYSYAKLLLDLYGLEQMDPETRLAKAERLEAAFAKINADWAAEGFVGKGKG